MHYIIYTDNDYHYKYVGYLCKERPGHYCRANFIGQATICNSYLNARILIHRISPLVNFYDEIIVFKIAKLNFDFVFSKLVVDLVKILEMKRAELITSIENIYSGLFYIYQSPITQEVYKLKTYLEKINYDINTILHR